MPPALFAIFAMPLLVLAVPSATVQAADAPYPVRPMRIVTGFPAGGNTDIIARSMAQKLTERMGQQVIVENRPGAGSMLGTEYVARATPDGYTLLLVSGAMTTQAAVMKKLILAIGISRAMHPILGSKSLMRQVNTFMFGLMPLLAILPH